MVYVTWFMSHGTVWLSLHQVNGGIAKQLNMEVLHYDYHASFFDIYVSLLRGVPYRDVQMSALQIAFDPTPGFSLRLFFALRHRTPPPLASSPSS